MSGRNGKKSQPRVLHVTNIPTPYRLPQYRAFRDALLARGIAFTVYFIGVGKRPRQWAIAEEDFGGVDRIFGDPKASIPRRAWGITRAIATLRPDVVVLAWAMDPTALLVLLHCRARRIPCLIYTGETDSAAAQRSWPGVRNAVRSIFLRVADGFVVYGQTAAQYLRARRVDDDRIAIAINVVDTEFFRRRVDQHRASGDAESARARFVGVDGESFATHFLFVGELIELKGLPLLIQAFARTDHSAALHLVGSGDQEPELRELVETLGVSGRVFFHGYQQKPELPLYYAMAHAMVFPSLKDVFGLVMVEAAAAGLPIVGSTLSGGSIDVIVPDVTGYIVDPRNIDEFATAISRLADNPQRRAEMGEASRAQALERLTPEVSALGYVRAIERCI